MVPDQFNLTSVTKPNTRSCSNHSLLNLTNKISKRELIRSHQLIYHCHRSWQDPRQPSPHDFVNTNWLECLDLLEGLHEIVLKILEILHTNAEPDQVVLDPVDVPLLLWIPVYRPQSSKFSTTMPFSLNESNINFLPVGHDGRLINYALTASKRRCMIGYFNKNNKHQSLQQPA